MNILGIHNGHDSSICLLKNGKIDQFFLTERFSRKKHDRILSKKQLDNIIQNNSIDAIAVSTMFIDHNRQQEFINDNFYNVMDICYNYSNNHHVSHASIAYYNSNFNNSLVFVVDGSAGSPIINKKNILLTECESVYMYEKSRTECLYKKVKEIGSSALSSFNPLSCEYDYTNTIGMGALYDEAAVVIGNTPDDCGKAMGLSAYGENNAEFENIFLKENTLDNDFFKQEHIVNFLSNPVKSITKNNYKVYADFCYEVQQQTQKALGDLIEKWSKETGIKNICISGGYGMNVVANHYLLDRFKNLNFHFEPMCNDSGISIGAAMHLYSKLKKWYQPKVKTNTTTSFHGYNYSYSTFSQYGVEESISGIANKLKNNKSVAIYYGKSEAGQRALGNRSILFNALNPNAKDIVNKIKNREWYRPFAAVVLQEDANRYFDMSLMPSSPYMTVAFPTKTDLVPGVTHVDNTCRVQTVTKTAGYLYDLLVEFKRITGHGIILNTSLNLAGDPLVETPQESFDVLMSSSLDYLWFPEIGRVYDHLPVYNQ